MIVETVLEQWRSNAPWPLLAQVEQDLIISRALLVNRKLLGLKFFLLALMITTLTVYLCHILIEKPILKLSDKLKN